MDPPPLDRPSIVRFQRATHQFTDSESPSKRAKVEPTKSSVDTAESHTAISADGTIATSYDSLTVAGLKEHWRRQVGNLEISDGREALLITPYNTARNQCYVVDVLTNER
jgi:hypothetical protein